MASKLKTAKIARVAFNSLFKVILTYSSFVGRKYHGKAEV